MPVQPIHGLAFCAAHAQENSGDVDFISHEEMTALGREVGVMVREPLAGEPGYMETVLHLAHAHVPSHGIFVTHREG